MSCMFFLLLFLAAAALVAFGLRIADSIRFPGGPRPEGLSFVLSVAIVGLVGMAYLTLSSNGASGQVYTTPEAVMARKIIPDTFVAGLQLWMLALAVYALSALRGVAGLPAWIADILVAGAA